MRGEWVEQYLSDCQNRRGLSANTLRAYRVDIEDFRRFWRRCNGDWDKSGAAYLTHLLVERSLSPSSARRRCVAVAAFLNWLNDAGFAVVTVIPEPPVKRGGSRDLPKTVNRRDLAALLTLAESGQPSHSVGLALRLMAATGMRVSEACSVKIRDLDLATGALRVRGKGARDRTVYIVNPGLFADLAGYASQREARSGLDGWLFLNQQGRQLQPQTIRSQLSRLVRTLGADRNITPHMLRHTCATIHLERGVDIRFVQRMLGHSSIATTEIYTHVTDLALQQAMGRGDPLASVAEATPVEHDRGRGSP
jgi:integrase/recombinase XerD